MRESSLYTIYCVRWRAANVVKVGYSDESRWRIFEARGAEAILPHFGDAAFESRADAIASGLLSSAACGYTECFRVTGDVLDADLIAELTRGLVFA